MEQQYCCVYLKGDFAIYEIKLFNTFVILYNFNRKYFESKHQVTAVVRYESTKLQWKNELLLLEQ